MKSTIAATLLALVAGLTITATPAQAVPDGPLAVSTSSLSIATSSSCATFPITWYLNSAPSGVDTWSVDGDIVDGAGASRGWIFEYESLPVSQAGASFTLCGLAEGANSFTVAADVDAWTPDYDMYSTRFAGTLTVTRTTPPPPPPVVFATRMVLNGDPFWIKRGTHARLIASIEFRGPCVVGKRSLTLSGRRSDGPWKLIGKTTVNSAERTSARARVPYSFRKVRFEVAATTSCTADRTAAIRVPRRR